MNKHVTSAQIIAEALGGAKKTGNGWMARCPCHQDRNPSLSIRDGENGVLIKCHAGCGQNDVIDALKARGLWPEKTSTGATTTGKRIVATYDYTDESGVLLFQVCRFEPKGFSQRRPDGRGRWIWNVTGIKPVPYRLPELAEAIANERIIFIVEGEKDVDSLAAVGVPASCNAGGAGKWKDDLNQHFRGADVIIIPDRDQPGRDHLKLVAGKLNGIAKRIRVLELPVKDASDWITAGGTSEQLYELAETAPEWKPSTTEKPSATETEKPLILSSADFVRGYVPADYLLDGVLQKRYCYSFTASTGTGKTAIMHRLAACVALGRKFGDKDVEKGRVLYLAGENPDNQRVRWLSLAQEMGFDPENIDVHFIPGTFKISAMRDRIRREMDQIGDFALIMVDTSAAYFEGEDENNNAQAGAWARMLRSLCELPGGPCVVVACHPVKRAGEDNLAPKGGGSFVNEVDGNLIATRDDSIVTVHWQVKFRGSEFNPMLFRLQTVLCYRALDSKGPKSPSVIVIPLSETDQESMVAEARSNENAMLEAISKKPNASLADLAELLGWKRKKDGKPDKTLAHRTVEALVKTKHLAKPERRGDPYTLTEKGKKLIKKITEPADSGKQQENT